MSEKRKHTDKKNENDNESNNKFMIKPFKMKKKNILKTNL